jgi:hypothetical protein
MIVRIVGLLLCLAGSGYLGMAITLLFYTNYHPSDVATAISWGTVIMIVGLYLLGGAPLIVHYAYRNQDSRKK